MEKNDQLKKKLYCRGFLITNDVSVNTITYPFFSAWKVRTVGKYSVIAHPSAHEYSVQNDMAAVGLIGHAYNPITGDVDESDILQQLLDVVDDRGRFWGLVNQLTGVFVIYIIENDTVTVFCDAVGLQSVFCCANGGNCYFSSHSNLIGDLLGLEEDPRVTELKKCRTFHYFGNQLPGNITQFSIVRRLVPNHYALYNNGILAQFRFYHPRCSDISLDEICDRLTEILKKTMNMIPKKWNRPAISLTGGCDSKTTLACASESYDKYICFSYDSQPNEAPDAEAAEKIAAAVGIPFKFYKISYDDKDFADIEDCRAVLSWNGGNVRENNRNDVRKRVFFDSVDDFDIEVKSWVSEIGRARYSKRYNGKKSFGKKPTPRKCTTFYKFFLNRRAVNLSDSIFREYLKNFSDMDDTSSVPWQDRFYWEWHWPSRDGLCLTAEQQYAYDITVPYNNRIILELLLSVPEQMRIDDTVYTMIRTRLDPRIDEVAATIVDVNHTKKRAFFELLYYYFNQWLPY